MGVKFMSTFSKYVLPKPMVSLWGSDMDKRQLSYIILHVVNLVLFADAQITSLWLALPFVECSWSRQRRRTRDQQQLSYFRLWRLPPGCLPRWRRRLRSIVAWPSRSATAALGPTWPCPSIAGPAPSCHPDQPERSWWKEGRRETLNSATVSTAKLSKQLLPVLTAASVLKQLSWSLRLLDSCWQHLPVEWNNFDCTTLVLFFKVECPP